MDLDLIIIGAGPGGYIAAIRAGQMGLKTALIERSDMGGMCLNWGCIPTKSLLESVKHLEYAKRANDFGVLGIDKSKLHLNWPGVVKRTRRIVKRLGKGVEYLLNKNGVEMIKGTASINEDHSISVENTLYKTKNIIIATGSKPSKIENMVPENIVLEIKDLWQLESLPEKIVVTGDGPHAVELAQFFKMADREVTLVTDKEIIMSQVDPVLGDYAEKILKNLKIGVIPSADITGYEKDQSVLKINQEIGDKRTKISIPCDRLVNANNRVAIIPECGFELPKNDGFIGVNQYLETSVENIYAVGDVNGLSMYAHSASAQGLYAVNRINGLNRDEVFQKEHSPINIYSHPEMAQVGLAEFQVQELKIPYQVSEFPLTANAKALIMGESDGFVRMLSDQKYGEVFGVQIVAPNATDMIAEAAILMEMEGTVFDLAKTIHAHPTISEIFMEVGFVASGHPVHK